MNDGAKVPAVQAAFRSMERFASLDEAVDFPGLGSEDEEEMEDEDNQEEMNEACNVVLGDCTVPPTSGGRDYVGMVVGVSVVLAVLTIGGVVFTKVWQIQKHTSTNATGTGVQSVLPDSVTTDTMIQSTTGDTGEGSMHAGESPIGTMDD
jgi:hypothetical protein